MTERRIAMTTRDRLLRGSSVVGAFGPIEMPSRDAIVRALRRIAAAGPNTRVGLGFDADGKNWTWDDDTLDEWCDEMVVSIAPASPQTIGTVAGGQRFRVEGAHPLCFVIAGDFIIEINDHALGDGVLFLDRLATTLQFAAGADEAPSWLAAKSERFPVLVAARETFLRGKAVRKALFASRRADRAIPNEPKSGARIPWHPEATMVTASASPTALKELQKWIRETDKTLTVSTALIVLLRRALEGAGLTLQRDTSMIYDLRRYLPEGRNRVSGNFIAGLPLRVQDPLDLQQISGVLRTHTASGRPLAALMVGIARHLVVGAPRQRDTTVRAQPRAHFVFNNMGMPRTLQQLPWSAPPDHRVSLSMVVPGGPEDIVVLASIVAGVISVTASFHSNVFDELVVEEALQRAMLNPLVLMGSRAGA